jgi:D-glycero-alpha-D-manno-heptose 1-phosphate guanylyltransferase
VPGSRAATAPGRRARRMDALILAGGLGTRLRAVVKDRAKSVAEIGGRPFLAHVLDRLARSAEVKRVILCVGHRADTVREALGTRHGRLAIAYSEEDRPLGTGGALRLAARRFGVERTALAMNGDTFFGARIDSLLAFHRAERAAATLALARVPDASRYGRVECSGNRVDAFLEKGAGGPAWISAGLYVFSPSAWRSLAALPASCSLEHDAFPRWLRTMRVAGYRTRSAHLDIGTPEDFSRAGGS